MITHYDIKSIPNFIELIPDLAFFKNMEGQYIYYNNLFLDFVQKRREDVINKTDFDLFSHESATEFRKDDLSILSSNTSKSYEEVLKRDAYDDLYFHTTKQIVYDEHENQLGLFCIARNITSKKEYELIYEDNKLLLEYIAINDNLTQVLNMIANLSEKRNVNSKSSILLLDKNKSQLFNASAPSLPSFYNDAIHGLKIGEHVGSCGSAVYKKERVIVENINTHKNWAPFLELTNKANLHACWSEPIFSSNNEIFGSFAIYHEKPKAPSDFELKLISSYAHLAAVAIEKEKNKLLLQEKDIQILEQVKFSNKKLESRENELEQLFQTALVGLMYITGERILIKGNQRLSDMFGYDNPDEMVGISMSQIHLSSDRFEEFGEKNFESLKYRVNFNIEYQLRKKDGTPLWCELSGKALDENIPSNLKKGVLWTINDISRRKRLEEKVQERTNEIEHKNEQLRILASKDYLTELYNRSKLDEVINYQLKRAKRYENGFGLILLDIDFFKLVNDTHGHQVGDKVLCEFSTILSTFSRETDTIGRWGGEEFLLIIENVDKIAIVQLAEKLRAKIENNIFSVVNNATASLGVTIYCPDDSMNDMIKRVDNALYNSKNNGRNRVSYL